MAATTTVMTVSIQEFSNPINGKIVTHLTRDPVDTGGMLKSRIIERLRRSFGSLWKLFRVEVNIRALKFLIMLYMSLTGIHALCE